VRHLKDGRSLSGVQVRNSMEVLEMSLSVDSWERG